MKQTQTQRILGDLLLGLHLNMINNIKRYGTSMRSRIAELRAEGFVIHDNMYKGKNYKVYFMPASFLKEYHSLKVSA